MAAGLLSYQRLSHEQRVSRLKDSIPDPGDDTALQKVSRHLDPDLDTTPSGVLSTEEC